MLYDYEIKEFTSVFSDPIAGHCAGEGHSVSFHRAIDENTKTQYIKQIYEIDESGFDTIVVQHFLGPQGRVGLASIKVNGKTYRDVAVCYQHRYKSDCSVKVFNAGEANANFGPGPPNDATISREHTLMDKTDFLSWAFGGRDNVATEDEITSYFAGKL